MRKKRLNWRTPLVSFLLFLSACGEDSPEGPALSGAPGSIATIAGLGPEEFDHTGDGGPAAAATLAWITSIAVDSSSNIYLADGAANTIRKITASDGSINTICGQFIGFNVIDPTPYAGDGGPATDAHINVPLSVDIDLLGRLNVIDGGNHVIRQIATDGIIATIAGNSEVGYEGDGGPAIDAALHNPYSIAADVQGNIYFVEAGSHTIRRIDKASGIVTTIAGLGPDEAGYTGDNGPAINARLNNPKGIALDATGNIYVADSDNGVIRKISGGTITTVAGNGTVGYSGDNGPAVDASFTHMTGIAVDLQGNIYVADSGNNAVRRIDANTGIITTLAGNGTKGYSGDGGPATSAQLNNPWDVAVDKAGNVYIADTANAVIRVVLK